MGEKFPRVTAAQIVKVLEACGFIATRQSGSHRIFKNADGQRATVPMHSGKTLHPKLLKNILHEAGLTADDLKKYL